MIKIPFFKLTFLFCIVSSSLLLHAGMPAGFGQDDLAGLEGRFNNMAKELEEMDKFIASLPPEEQAEFFKQVEEVQTILNQMSPEELDQLMQEVAQMAPELFGELPPEIANTPIVQPEKLTPEVPQVVQTVSLELSAAEAEALNYIETIIKHTNAFLVKINSNPDLPGTIERWGSQGKINNWSLVKTRAELFKSLDLLLNILFLAKEQEASNKNYIHLKEIAKVPELMNSLKGFSSALSEYEPKVEVQSFGITKIEKRSKDALKVVLDIFIKNLFTNSIYKQLEVVLAKYAPTAEKLKAAQKAIEERAQAQASRVAVPGRTVIGGQQDSSFDDYGSFGRGSFGGYPTDTGYSGSYNPNYGSSGPQDRDLYGPSGSKPSTAKPKEIGSKPSGASAKGKIDKSKTKTEKKDPAADRLLGQIEANFDTVSALINENAPIKNIKTHLFDAVSTPDILTINNLATLDKRTNELVSNIKSLDRMANKLDGDTKKYYKEQLSDLYSKHQSSITTLVNQISEIEREWDTFKPRISGQKRYAYFKEEVPGQITPKPGTLPAQPQTLTKPAEREELEKFVGSLKPEKQEQVAQVTKEIEEQITKEQAQESTESEVEQLAAPQATPAVPVQQTPQTAQPAAGTIASTPATTAEIPLQSTKTLFEVRDTLRKLVNAVKEFGASKK